MKEQHLAAVLGLHLILYSSLDFVKAADIYFYQHQGFQGAQLSSEKITTSCENLPWDRWNQVSSIKAWHCVLLYTSPDCTGNYFRLEQGYHSTLPYIEDDLDSFRACDGAISRTYPFKDARVILYQRRNFDSPISDKLLYTADCVTLPERFWNKAVSVKTPICILFFANPNCQGRQFRHEKGDTAYLALLREDIDSYRPCNPEDILKPTKLMAKAVGFRVYQNSQEVANRARTVYGEMSARTTFWNSRGAFLNQNYAVEKTEMEKVVVERSETVSKVHGFDVSASLSTTFENGHPVRGTRKDFSVIVGCLSVPEGEIGNGEGHI